MSVTMADRLRRKLALTPEDGCNLVGVDTFGETAEEELYLIGHFPSRKEALAAQRAFLKGSSDTTYLYSSEDEAR